MRNALPALASLMVSVLVRRKSRRTTSVRLSTDPASSPEAIRSLAIAVEPTLAARLEEGTYRIERTMRSGSRLAGAPDGAEASSADELVESLVAPMDELLRTLIGTLLGIPDEAKLFAIVREAYALVYGTLLNEGTVAECVRPGFCTIVPCAAPSGIELALRRAADGELPCGESLLQNAGVPVAIVREQSRVRMHLGTVGDRNPFRELHLNRVRALIPSVQDRAERMEAHRLQGACAEEAARQQHYASALSAAFGFTDAPAAVSDEPPTMVWRQRETGEA